MKFYTFIGIVLSLILGFVSYFATSNILIGGGILLFCTLFYFLIIHKTLKSYLNNVSKIHSCYLFINDFLVSLSVKESLSAAFDNTKNAISDDYREFITSVDELNPQEKLMYLTKYYPYHIYQIFVDIILLWLDQGGKILDMSSSIANEMREIEEYVTYCQSVHRRKAFEIGVLWLFSLTIVIILRFALTDFYDELSKQLIFIISIILLVGLVLLSIYLLVNRISKIEVRGIKNGK